MIILQPSVASNALSLHLHLQCELSLHGNTSITENQEVTTNAENAENTLHGYIEVLRVHSDDEAEKRIQSLLQHSLLLQLQQPSSPEHVETLRIHVEKREEKKTREEREGEGTGEEREMKEELTLVAGSIPTEMIPPSSQLNDYEQCKQWQLNQVLNHAHWYTYRSSSPISNTTDTTDTNAPTTMASEKEKKEKKENTVHKKQHAISCTRLNGLHSPQFMMLQLVNEDTTWINENAWIGWHRDLRDQVNLSYETLCRRELGVKWRKSMNLMTNQPYEFTVTHSIPFFLPALHPALYDILTRRRPTSLLSPREALGRLRTLDEIVLLLPVSEQLTCTVEAKESFPASEGDINQLPIRVRVETPAYEADLIMLYSSSRVKIQSNSTMTAMKTESSSSSSSSPNINANAMGTNAEKNKYARPGASPQARYFNSSNLFNRRLQSVSSLSTMSKIVSGRGGRDEQEEEEDLKMILQSVRLLFS